MSFQFKVGDKVKTVYDFEESKATFTISERFIGSSGNNLYSFEGGIGRFLESELYLPEKPKSSSSHPLTKIFK